MNHTPAKNNMAQFSPKDGTQSLMNGYMSHGAASDAGSARLSNINTFKYNNPMTNIRKVSPQAGNTMDYSSGAENKLAHQQQ